jgi:tRNA(fMet)-specific endonuclease VapC
MSTPTPGRAAIDTNIAIDILNGESGLDERLAESGEVLLPAPVLGELLYGARRSDRVAENEERVRELGRVTRLVPCDEAASEAYGTTKARLMAVGKPIPDNDLWIAACCLAVGAVLVSLVTLTSMPSRGCGGRSGGRRRGRRGVRVADVGRDDPTSSILHPTTRTKASLTPASGPWPWALRCLLLGHRVLRRQHMAQLPRHHVEGPRVQAELLGRDRAPRQQLHPRLLDTEHPVEWYVVEEGGADGLGYEVCGRSLQALRAMGK